MKTLQLASLALGGVLSLLGACDLDVPDLNDPSLSDLEENPTAVQIQGACTGLLIGNRGNTANANGYVSQLGILGRESYNFDGADPRYVGELIVGSLNRGSPFGGNFWAGPYGNIRLANVILRALDKIDALEFDDGEKAAIRGFVHTLQAMDLLIVINAHDTTGAVIDTDQPIVLPPAVQPLGDIVSKGEVFTEIARLLDDAAKDLAAAGAGSLPFQVSPGYSNAGFASRAGFLRFNRALRARVAAYMASDGPASGYATAYATALDALEDSFIEDDVTMVPASAIDFSLGAYHVYSTKTGDTTNALINPNIYASPLLETDAQKNAAEASMERPDGIDLRYLAKVTPIGEDEDPGSVTDTPLTSSLRFSLYDSPDDPVAIIRNEELILLKAEALFFTGDVAGAVAELNIVRVGSGGLPPLLGLPTETAFLDALLYERRYSLMFEGGHRWIDLRRFERITDIVLEDPSYTRNVRYPIPQPECNGRPGEPACELSSTL